MHVVSEENVKKAIYLPGPVVSTPALYSEGLRQKFILTSCSWYFSVRQDKCRKLVHDRVL